MSNNVIVLADYKYPWHEVFSADGPVSTLQVYVNSQTGEAEVVQMNDEGEVIRTPLDVVDASLMAAALLLQKARASV